MYQTKIKSSFINKYKIMLILQKIRLIVIQRSKKQQATVHCKRFRVVQPVTENNSQYSEIINQTLECSVQPTNNCTSTCIQNTTVNVHSKVSCYMCNTECHLLGLIKLFFYPLICTRIIHKSIFCKELLFCFANKEILNYKISILIQL